MKKRILTGWNFRRVIYLVLGMILTIRAIELHEWLAVLIGGYFISMGIFAFGCASGNCFGGTCYKETENQSSLNEEVKYKEVNQNRNRKKLKYKPLNKPLERTSE